MATLHLMVGLPATGKTTHAKHLADHLGGLRLTPDEWMIPLFADSEANGKRDVLEGRLISTGLQVLRLGVDVILDFGLWDRDERYALHQLAIDQGAQCVTVYLPVDRQIQLARIHQRWETTPDQTYPITEADIDRWREQFQEPDAAELAGASPPPRPQPWPSWWDWAAERWPSLSTPWEHRWHPDGMPAGPVDDLGQRPSTDLGGADGL